MTLDDRQRVLLQHVARYRLTTVAAVRTVTALRLKTNANALAFLQQMVRDGWLGEAQFDRHESYFFLTKQGTNAISRSASRFGPLSESAKLRAFAMLAFCRLMNANRERLSPDDLRRLVPGLDTSGMNATFYAERTDTARTLGFARLDIDGTGRWDRILATLAEDVRNFEAEPSLKPFIAAKSFEVTLITLTPEKAERLRTTFFEKQSPTILVNFIAVPRLLTLTGTIRAPPKPDSPQRTQRTQREKPRERGSEQDF
jgi:hypothetical protein